MTEAVTSDNKPQGRDGPKCAAIFKGRPPCQLPAGWGTDHVGIGRCRKHGGATANHRKKAEGEKAEMALRALGRPTRQVDNPIAELQALASEVVGWKEALGGIVAGLESLTVADLNAARAEVALFERALDRCAVVLGLIAKLNLDERMLRINDRQGQLMAVVVARALEKRGLPAADVGVLLAETFAEVTGQPLTIEGSAA